MPIRNLNRTNGTCHKPVPGPTPNPVPEPCAKSCRKPQTPQQTVCPEPCPKVNVGVVLELKMKHQKAKPYTVTPRFGKVGASMVEPSQFFLLDMLNSTKHQSQGLSHATWQSSYCNVTTEAMHNFRERAANVSACVVTPQPTGFGPMIAMLRRSKCSFLCLK